jgi:hypothetical protein
MIAPLKVSTNHIATTFLTTSMRLSAATGVRWEELPVPVWKRTWLQPAGNNAYSDELLVASRTAFPLCNLLFMVLYTYTMQEITQIGAAAGAKHCRRKRGFPSCSFCQRELRIRGSMASLQTSERVHGEGFVV